MSAFVSWALFLFLVSAAFLYAYVAVVRPILRRRPDLKEFYDRCDSNWAKLVVTLQGYRTLAFSVLQVVAGWFLFLHDSLAMLMSTPMFGSFDWTPISTRLFNWVGVPPDMQGTAMFMVSTVLVAGLGHLHKYLREITDGPVGAEAPAVAATVFASLQEQSDAREGST